MSTLTITPIDPLAAPETGVPTTTDRLVAVGPAAVEAAVLVAAQRLAAEASTRAEEIEAARTLPCDLVEVAKADGLFRLALPRSLGGLELDPLTLVRVVETVSRGDGSTGWTTMIGNGSCFFAYLDPAEARSMIGTAGDVTCAGVFAPKGMAVAGDPGMFTVGGRWTFNSGVNHAAWHIQGVLVSDGGPPRLLADGSPDWRFAYFPHDADLADGGSIEVVDTWHALGLRGSGSNDLAVRGVRVPEAHTVLPFTVEAPHDGPLWRLRFVDLLGAMMVGVPLGIGRRALDEVVEVVGTRSRPGSMAPLSADAVVQERIGRADGRLQAARALVDDAVGSAWSTACRGDRPSEAEHLRIQVAMIEALDAAVHAVDTAFTLAGSAAVMDGSVIQRCFRDIHTAAQHVAFASTPHQELTRLALGGAGD